MRANRPGARFHAQRAVTYYRSGLLETIEHQVAGGRVDMLLRTGMQVDAKAWHAWATLGESVRIDRLTKLEGQVHRYLSGGDRLRFEFKGSILGDVEELLQNLQETYGKRLTWRVI